MNNPFEFFGLESDATLKALNTRYEALKKEFQEIVRVLAKKGGIDMPEEELLLEANKWELSHGGLSGRTAQQFIDYLMGKSGFVCEDR